MINLSKNVIIKSVITKINTTIIEVKVNPPTTKEIEPTL